MVRTYPEGPVVCGDVMCHDRYRIIAAGDNTSPNQGNVPGSCHYPIGTAIEGTGNGTTIVRVRLDGLTTAAA